MNGNWRHAAAVCAALAALTASSCSDGGDSPPAASAPTTTVSPNTSSSTTSTPRSSTSTSTSTSTTAPAAELTRDAELAVLRCLDSWFGIGLSLMVADSEPADDALALCEEAALQLRAEDAAAAGDIRLEILGANVDVAKAVFDALIAEYPSDAAAELDVGLLERAERIEQLLDD